MSCHPHINQVYNLWISCSSCRCDRLQRHIDISQQKITLVLVFGKITREKVSDPHSPYQDPSGWSWLGADEGCGRGSERTGLVCFSCWRRGQSPDTNNTNTVSCTAWHHHYIYNPLAPELTCRSQHHNTVNQTSDMHKIQQLPKVGSKLAHFPVI